MKEITQAHPEANKVIDVVSHLSGQNCYAVLENVARARGGFERRDDETQKLLTSDPASLVERLKGNRFIYSDFEPAEESVFVYFDLSTSVELISYIARIRDVIHKCLGHIGHNGEDVIRYSDLKVQHSTAFGELTGDKFHISGRLVNCILRKYEPTLKSFVPFNLFVIGPHLAPSGGVILECAVYSQQYYNLRQMAEKDLTCIRAKAKRGTRGIHDIIHSTVGYITQANAEQLMRLHEEFKSLRSNSKPIAIRMRDGRIITTLNRQLIGTPLRVDFAGTRGAQISSEEAGEALRLLIELASSWLRVEDLRYLVLEEVMYWFERFEWPQSPAHEHALRLISQYKELSG